MEEDSSGAVRTRNVKNEGYELDIKLSCSDLALLVIITPLQDRPCPLSHQLISLSPDAYLWPLALGIVQHNLSNTAAQKRLLLDR